MAHFKNSEEFSDMMDQLFKEASKHPKISKRVKALKPVIRLEFTEPDVVIIMDCSKGKLTCTSKNLKVKTDVEVCMKVEVAHRFWLGKLNMIVAARKREIVAKGNLGKIVGFIPVLKHFNKIYKDILEARGRSDLL